MITLEQLLEDFTNEVEQELSLTTLEDWSINVAGYNFMDQFKRLELDGINDLIKEIEEGRTVEIKINVAEPLLESLYAVKVAREREKSFRE